MKGLYKICLFALLQREVPTHVVVVPNPSLPESSSKETALYVTLKIRERVVLNIDDLTLVEVGITKHLGGVWMS